MNQRAAMSQMQMPPPQSATSPTQGGMTRGMLASQYTSQQVLHHPGAMGMPMVNPRNLHSPAHPQMTQQNRVPLHQHGMSNGRFGSSNFFFLFWSQDIRVYDVKWECHR